MKVAIVHNDYGKFSGEEAVVRDHAELLTGHGVQVVQFRRSSAELRGLAGAAKGFFSGIYNPFSRRRFAHFLDAEKPDVVHIHNLYPLISPCILPEAGKRGIPVVMTVHNFRLFCPNGLFFDGNGICESCAEKHSVLPCLKKNCLHSRFKTLGYALRTWSAQHCQWYPEHVNRFLCLTGFQLEKLVSYGIPRERCRIVPNFISSTWLKDAGQTVPGASDYVAYMGRLSKEKGIDLLLETARKLPEVPFRIAGSGMENYQSLAPQNVEFVGYLTGPAQFEFMHNAAIQVMASHCYENFPTTLLQGMALGIPAVVPEQGGMPEIISGTGDAFKQGQLTEILGKLWHDPSRREIYRNNALRKIQDFSPEHCWELLKEAYSF